MRVKLRGIVPHLPWNLVQKDEGKLPAQTRPWARGHKRAVLNPWFPARAAYHVFRAENVTELLHSSTDILAGPSVYLLVLAELAREVGSTPYVRSAVIPLLHPGQPGLTSRQRETLWHAFEAPVLQEYRGPDGDVLAWECEAQCGFHIAASLPNAAVPGTLVRARCPCGLDTPRIVCHPHATPPPAPFFSAPA